MNDLKELLEDALDSAPSDAEKLVLLLMNFLESEIESSRLSAREELQEFGHSIKAISRMREHQVGIPDQFVVHTLFS